jgi:pimeloyl-ACP methyl ester carboxylesterase
MSSDLSYFVRTDCTELTLGLDDGSRIAVKMWGPENGVRCLCLHGWLDNAATYDRLAPLVTSSPRLSVRMVCMDFTGHGWSSHRSRDGGYAIADRAVEVARVADALRWERFVLIGHSMGAGVATLFAGSQPKRVLKLILLDGIGVWIPRQSNPQVLEAAIEERTRLLRRQRRVYPTIDVAVSRYLKNNPYMKEESARLLVARGTEEVETFDSGNNEGENIEAKNKEVGICFRHDPRLTGSSTFRYQEEDMLDFCRRVECPVLIFIATNPLRRELAIKSPGSYMGPLYARRIAALRDFTMVFVEGSHHLHLDQADVIYKAVIDFLVDPALFAQRGKLLPFPTEALATPHSKL